MGHWSVLRCHTAARDQSCFSRKTIFSRVQSCLLCCSNAVLLSGLWAFWTIISKTKDEWTLGIQRGRRVLAVRHIPVVWLVMCAKPGKLLASFASPPLVSSWWMAVVLATPPVVTTGTALSKVLPLAPTELRTGPWDLPQIAWKWTDRKRKQQNKNYNFPIDIYTRREWINYIFHSPKTTFLTVWIY